MIASFKMQDDKIVPGDLIYKVVCELVNRSRIMVYGRFYTSQAKD